MKEKRELYEKQLNIPADSFLYSINYKNFNAYKKFREAFKFAHKHKVDYALDSKTITNFISLNPEYYETYFLLGNYFKDENEPVEARYYYVKARTKEITTEQDKETINKLIDDLIIK